MTRLRRARLAWSAWWARPLPSWYLPLLTAVVAAVVGAVAMTGVQYARAVHARAVVQQQERHAPAVTAT